VRALVPVAPPPSGFPAWVYWVFIGFWSLLILVAVASLIWGGKR
jgi:hypothetical protein